jgi:transcriptional regulator GlxA family with amidase domain
VKIAIPIFDGITALDAVGPYEVLARIPGARVTFVATQPGTKRTDNGSLGLVADRSLADLPDPDVVLVPGGYGTDEAENDETLLAWLRAAHETTTWTTSVCTGAFVLGAAGLLQGRRATTHWGSIERLRVFGAEPVHERVVTDGKIMCAAGVSSGIDMALALAATLTNDVVAQAIQLGIEYDPAPPFDAGTPFKAPPEVVDLVRKAIAARRG